jgi:hypothetical protein
VAGRADSRRFRTAWRGAPDAGESVESVARVVLDERGPLAQQIATAAEPRPRPPRFQPSGASVPGNMQSTSGRGSTRLLPGAMFSRTTSSAVSSPKRAEDSPGRSTAGRTVSPPGRTIRSPTRRAKRSTCGTRRPRRFGRRRRSRRGPTPHARLDTERATRSGDDAATGLSRSSSCSYHLATR